MKLVVAGFVIKMSSVKCRMVISVYKIEAMKRQEEFVDADSINMENDYEVQYWTSQLKVTNDKLKEAVAEVGNEIEAVKVYMNRG